MHAHPTHTKLQGGKSISVVAYFKGQYGALRFPHLPPVNVSPDRTVRAGEGGLYNLVAGNAGPAMAAR